MPNVECRNDQRASCAKCAFCGATVPFAEFATRAGDSALQIWSATRPTEESRLVDVIDLDETDAGAAVLAGEDDGEGSRRQRNMNTGLGSVRRGETERA